MRLPPKWVRRGILAPLVIALALVVVALLPAWLAIAVIVSIFVEPRLRTPRLLVMVAVYLLWDAAAIVALFALWVASGFGWRIHSHGFQRAHYRFVARMLEFLFWNVHWVLRLDIDVRVPEGFHDDDEPRVIASRHAGPGDSFILIHAVLNWFDRSPRIVLKDTMQWDPAVDVVLNRLPNRFIAPPPVAGTAGGRRRARRGGAPSGSTALALTDRISELASDMGPRDALVIFPEGGNFTPERRARAIARLRAAGLAAAAERAARLMNVMAPRPAGLFAALDAAPHADVFLVAHTGLDRIRTVGDVWRALPTDKTITMQVWNVPRTDIPDDHDARTDWLMGEWERIDGWIEARRR
ncbi:1-acyl-sn-glycerol-3-phosphate acyltransferase [Agromyces bracchium]|uniref:1-acyl-sn-glycerol-3-phosphate acyltransferase n=1 Tax=Agromyces bracchium TaxID=88376 RepID=A0A6I3M6C0_9MICO|nr:1-acyl-sn-glycerol-3-phosphate acyltransferase [Agromyces bracchium]MTH66876.1 1-acyl-sn-glycerol-3-phosphate acyltransferase [Agromyces bracchium]